MVAIWAQTGGTSADWLERQFQSLADFFARTFGDSERLMFLSQSVVLEGLVALVLVGLVCGAVGSLVVGNRMAFFSDALAHCAFAGVGLGILLGFVTGATASKELGPWLVFVMAVFGIFMGLGIAFVREKTSQANDTVIGVFFAGAIGLGAVFLKAAEGRYVPPEDFLFGNIVSVESVDIITLAALLLVTGLVMSLLYNRLVFSSFSPSLARSRGFPIRLLSYVFIVLLALIVNLCLKAVGVLLINALLIVPAAAAANLSRNMRQFFFFTVCLSVFGGLVGHWLSWELTNLFGTDIGESGVIVLLLVACYFLSIPVGVLLHRAEKRRRVAPVVMGGSAAGPAG